MIIDFFIGLYKKFKKNKKLKNKLGIIISDKEQKEFFEKFKEIKIIKKIKKWRTIKRILNLIHILYNNQQISNVHYLTTNYDIYVDLLHMRRTKEAIRFAREEGLF